MKVAATVCSVYQIQNLLVEYTHQPALLLFFQKLMMWKFKLNQKI